jgi:hypothetical protein
VKGSIRQLPIVDMNPNAAHKARLYPIQPVRIYEDDSFCFPSRPYWNFVAFYYQIRLDARKSRSIYPTGHTGVVCRLDNLRPASYVVGTPTVPREAEYADVHGDYFIALFWLGMGYCLFPVPPAEIADGSVPLDAMYPESSQRFTRSMALAGSFQHRVHIFEEFLSKIIAGSRKIPQHHVQLLYNVCNSAEKCLDIETGEPNRIDLSSRQVRRLFLRYLGIPPNLASRIFRYQKALRVLNAHPEDCLAGLAIDQGYFDQSHFIKEFKRFQGETPTEFLYKFKIN